MMLSDKKMPQAIDVTVLIDVFKGPKMRHKLVCWPLIFKLSRRMFLLYLLGSDRYSPQECLGKGAPMVPV